MTTRPGLALLLKSRSRAGIAAPAAAAEPSPCHLQESPAVDPSHHFPPRSVRRPQVGERAAAVGVRADEVRCDRSLRARFSLMSITSSVSLPAIEESERA